MSTPRVRLPRSARAGESIEVRTLIDHPMATGIASLNPRNMLATFEALMNGETVFRYEFGNGSAANPTFTFHVRASEPGQFEFIWTHEDGTEFRADESVAVS